MGGLSCFVVYLFVLSQYLIVIEANGVHMCTVNSIVHPQGICGKYLTEMLSVVCGKTGYVEKTYGKRSETPASILDMDVPSFMELSQESTQPKDNSLLDILYNKRDANAFLDKRTAYFRKGISCECCYHKCSIKEIASYCKNPKKALAMLALWPGLAR